MKKIIIVGMAWLNLAIAQGAVIYSQWPANPPVGGIPSQWWYDPTQQNNLDSDAEGYDDFVLAQAATVTHVEWWGQSVTFGVDSVGFFIGFYNQDTNTTALQPDLVQFYGHAPLAYETVTNFTETAVGNGMSHFSADLPAPVSLAANSPSMPRYFISVSDSMPIAYATWTWAQGFGGNGSMFYFQLAGSLAGGPYYSYRSWDCAFLLADASAPPAEPVLGVSAGTNNTVVLSWPASATGFRPQVCMDLRNGAWSDAQVNVTLVGNLRETTLPATASQGYFRLVYP